MSREEVVAAVEQLLDEGAEFEVVEQLLSQVALAEEEEQEEEATEYAVTRRKWNIRDQAKGDATEARKMAESLTRRVKRLTQALHEDEVVVAEQKAKLDEYLKQRREATEKQETWLLDRLLEYKHDFHPHERTVKLVAGTLQLRAIPPPICWDDPRARCWAEEHPDAERLLKVDLRREEIKRRLCRRGDEYLDPRTGEIVNFVKHEDPPEADRFSVT